MYVISNETPTVLIKFKRAYDQGQGVGGGGGVLFSIDNMASLMSSTVKGSINSFSVSVIFSVGAQQLGSMRTLGLLVDPNRFL